jgi:hypothetical protein
LGLFEITVEKVRKWEEGRDVKNLIKVLGNSNKYVRIAAARALGKIGDKRAVEPLSKALEDRIEDVRYTAFRSRLEKLNTQTKRYLNLSF